MSQSCGRLNTSQPSSRRSIRCAVSGDSGAQYNSAPTIKFLYFHSKSQEQIIISDENDKQSLIASDITAQLDREIVKKKQEIQDLEDRKAYFLRNFESYWNPLVVPTTEGESKVVQ